MAKLHVTIVNNILLQNTSANYEGPNKVLGELILNADPAFYNERG